MKVPEIRLTREQIARLTPTEKRNYLFALVTMASCDDELASEELALIRLRAKELDSELIRVDLHTYDIESIASQVRKPSLVDALFQDLINMGGADRKWRAEELQLLDYFAKKWELSIPALPGVEGKDIVPLTRLDLEETSVRKQEALLSPQNRDILRSASPGIRWNWVLIGAGIYLGLAGMMCYTIYVFQGQRISTSEEVAYFAGRYWMYVLFLSCLLTGFTVGAISPARTLKEPAIGVLLPLGITGGGAIVVLLLHPATISSLGSFHGGFLVGVLVVQFLVALFGAWLGQKLTKNS